MMHSMRSGSGMVERRRTRMRMVWRHSGMVEGRRCAVVSDMVMEQRLWLMVDIMVGNLVGRGKMRLCEMEIVHVDDGVIAEGRMRVGLVITRVDRQQRVRAVGMGVGLGISQEQVSLGQQFRAETWKGCQSRG